MSDLESNVVTLHAERVRPSCEATESLRLLKAFMALGAARRSAIVEELEAEMLSLLPADRR